MYPLNKKGYGVNHSLGGNYTILYSVFRLHEGSPIFRLHELRHTFATLALQNGVDVKTVSSMLGHYDAGFTLRTYTHATRQMQDDAAEKMGSFMAQVM